jgi:hypothetical protein
LSEKTAANYFHAGFSHMQSEISCDRKDHDHHADNVKNIHCFAPLKTCDLEISLANCALHKRLQSAKRIKPKASFSIIKRHLSFLVPDPATLNSKSSIIRKDVRPMF